MCVCVCVCVFVCSYVCECICVCVCVCACVHDNIMLLAGLCGVPLWWIDCFPMLPWFTKANQGLLQGWAYGGDRLQRGRQWSDWGCTHCGVDKNINYRLILAGGIIAPVSHWQEQAPVLNPGRMWACRMWACSCKGRPAPSLWILLFPSLLRNSCLKKDMRHTEIAAILKQAQIGFHYWFECTLSDSKQVFDCW